MTTTQPTSGADAVKPTVLPAGTPLPDRPATSAVLPTDGSAPSKPRRTRKGWDIGLSILVILVSWIAYSVAAILGFLAVAFFTGCNDHGCGSGMAPYIAAVVLACLVVIGSIATVVALVLKFRGILFAVLTLATVVIGWIVIFAISAVGS